MSEDKTSVCPIGDYRGQPWSNVPSSFLRWMLAKSDAGESLCEWAARRPHVQARVRQELAERDRPPGSVAFPGFES